MQISTKGRYGLRAVLELARRSGDKPVSTKDISLTQKITIPYLEQLFFRLKNKGFVRSVRGAQGGYFLARKPSEISVGEIIECLDGPIEFTDCKSTSDGHSTCIGPENCIAISFWDDLKEMINDRLYKTTLADLIEDFQQKKVESRSL
jgi:Rrf2 family transcriptional regulator, cysteine metabolism repressor